MTMSTDRLELIMLRNSMSRGILPENFLSTFEQISIRANSSPMRHTFLFGLQNAEKHIKRGHIEKAAHELNFIHNLPLTKQELSVWDKQYFLEFELLGYIETSNYKCINKALQALGQDLIALDMREH